MVYECNQWEWDKLHIKFIVWIFLSTLGSLKIEIRCSIPSLGIMNIDTCMSLFGNLVLMSRQETICASLSGLISPSVVTWCHVLEVRSKVFIV